MKTLNNFDYVTYLKRHLLVGQVDSWRRTEEGKPLYTVLVSLDIALKECSEWSGQEITRTEFINYLKLNDILCLRNVDEFKKLKEELKEQRDEIALKPKKRQISEERRKQLSENMKKIRASLPGNP